MPRAPRTSSHARSIRSSTFEAVVTKLRQKLTEPGFVPLHLGDTHPLPPAAARGVSLDDPAVHRYGPVSGLTSLRAAGALDLTRMGLPVEADQVFIAPGATGGLDVATDATLEPGDEVVLLTPTWPLLFGLVQRRGATPVEVEVGAGGWPDGGDALRERLEAAVTERTVALSLCDPNNPAGFVYDAEHFDAVADVAERHDLWVYYDAVYVDLVFEPQPRPLARVAQRLRERAFVVTSFSKTFGLAGHRVGLLVPPPAAQDLAPRLLTHTTYHTGNLAQHMALAALQADPAAERARRRTMARDGAARACRALEGRIPFRAPQAGAFVLLDLRERLADEGEAIQFLDRCLEAGVSLAPGGAFGSSFGRFVRLCFTSVRAAELEVGLHRLVGVLEED